MTGIFIVLLSAFEMSLFCGFLWVAHHFGMPAMLIPFMMFWWLILQKSYGQIQIEDRLKSLEATK